jgi:glycosyltransferase AglI
MAPLVSVIIPARNSGKRMPALLGALARQTLPAEAYEVIVVDDASSDDTFDQLDSSSLVRPLRMTGHGGPYAARNLGAEAATGEVLAFTDTDCDPRPDWLEQGLAALRRDRADMVAGRIDMPVDPEAPAVALVDFTRSFDQKSSAERGFAATANLFVDKRAFEAAGGFNVKMLAGGDREFGQRAVAGGAVIAYAHDAVVAHGPRTTPRSLARKAFRIGFGLAQQKRHAAAVDRVQPWTRAGYYVPHRHLPGYHRLDQHGMTVPRGKLATMHACAYLCFQLPFVAGNIAGTVMERRSLHAASKVA